MINKDLFTIIQNELEMCVKYPFYQCTLYYQNDVDHQKIKILGDIIKQIVQEKYNNEISIINYIAQVYYKANFKNHSRFYVTPFYENTRGLRNHRCLIDNEIPQGIARRIISYSLMDVERYNSVFGERGRMVDDQDKSHFGTIMEIKIL